VGFIDDGVGIAVVEAFTEFVIGFESGDDFAGVEETVWGGVSFDEESFVAGIAFDFEHGFLLGCVGWRMQVA
jgi:hypothetical protein